MNLVERNEAITAYLRHLEPWERGHAERVAVYSVAVAVKLKVPARQLLAIRYAATLHGVARVSEASVDPGLMRLPFLRAAKKLLAQLEEPVDLGARIVAVCEAFDRFAYGSPGVEPEVNPLACLESSAYDPAVVEALRQIAGLIQPIGT